MNKIFLSFLLVFVCILSPLYSLNVAAANKDAVTISMRNNALNAALKFLSAQKKCKAEDMIQYSYNIQNIDSISEYYQNKCKEHPLQNAEVTDLAVVSNELAIVSTKLEFADRVVVQISPIIKADGKWKLVKGINQGLASANAEKINPDILEGINGYFNGLRSGEIAEVDKYGTYLGKDEQYKESLLNDKRMKMLKYKANRLKMISETIAVATIETSIDHQPKERKYIIYKENNIWKIIYNMPLVTTTIPKSANPVKVK